jgi:hypothetical protein
VIGISGVIRLGDGGILVRRIIYQDDGAVRHRRPIAVIGKAHTSAVKSAGTIPSGIVIKHDAPQVHGAVGAGARAGYNKFYIFFATACTLRNFIDV